MAAPPAPVALCRCYVAGFRYHQWATLLPRLKERQALVLKREPENPHDPLAIAVHAVNGDKLGYLPWRLNEIPAGLMDGGRSLWR
ncbi:HIRAN domain-containing protein [Desulfurivibrio sp. C05AmB]|uniref:HIRAN domain-containing protein n=1 Tax=Desulfurivibrio sp. C05AmB TaxID=3374371 RepID=UPI00376F3FF8